mmetsp:Transcript_17976/g.32826  ORF Transcript_17976/g.32826 Transcript_17976/m.32826 type:complete len:208 (-) Transcript_17976:383-1006(-)
MSEPEVYLDESGVRRIRNKELVLPIIFGTQAWWLGKKQSQDYSTHRWTVYVRGPNFEDLSRFISKVTFELHPTFSVPKRLVEQQPFEVTESGWGEFDINITLHFSSDSEDKSFSFVHRLQFYEGENVQQTTKKPVINEVYEEVVFVDPCESFYKRVTSVIPGPAPELSCKAFCPPVDDREEIERYNSARARVAAMVVDVKRDFDSNR